ncbi:MAG: DUF362 domain-containing protein [Candidatus Omnitrophica bacterium]|nr:DUF362 domain-containing protein [Candidatus Omnitrophota bacterium]MDD5655091.1 DUF362 domain-containing protein [Candidatus Omnitrophota bacterium]
MKSKVYFISVEDLDDLQAIKAKFTLLLDESGMLDFLLPGKTAAIKMHFGEEGNTGHVSPEYVRMVCDRISAKGAKPVLVDTNTLYRGKRSMTASHIQLARGHGFTEEIAGAPITIAEDSVDVEVGSQFLKTAKVAPFFLKVDALVGIAHFKGHLMTGFGGMLKNIGMGCASREGKLIQHSDYTPIVKEENCVGCGACEAACPARAISIVNDIARIEGGRCIGCASCISACPNNAIDLDWEAGAGTIQEKMVGHAKAVLSGKKDKLAFFNFAIKITKECDCLAKDDPRICPDVGIFASCDPVSIDKACLDVMIRTCGKDVFMQVHPKRDGTKQLYHAAKLGLGNIEYDLVNLSY